MPVVELDKKDVLKLIGKNMPDNILADRISMLGTDLDEVGKNTIKVEIFPNRPDMLGEEGFARALSSFVGVKKGLRKYSVQKGNYKARVNSSVRHMRGCVCAAVVKDAVLTDIAVKSLMQLQEKLHTTHGLNRKRVSIGVYDLDTISFPLTYTTKEKDFKFVPLGESKQTRLSQILLQHPKGKEYAPLLNGCNFYPIWIDAKNQVLSMPPIINSEETKITSSTKNLFIDVTGTDQHAVEQALNIIVCSLADRGAKVYGVEVEGKNFPSLEPEQWNLDIIKVNKLLGLNLEKSDIKKYLEIMGHGYDGKKAYVPCYRTNILHQVDIIEDIGIAYGYENFKPEIPNVATIGEENSLENFKNKVAVVLVGAGLIETTSYNLTSTDVQNKKMLTNNDAIEVSNPTSMDYHSLRYWLIPSLLDILSRNKHYEYPQNIFEVGMCFKKSKNTETFGEEETVLAIALSNPKANFTEIKQLIEYLFSSFGIPFELKEEKHPSFIDGRIGQIIVHGKKVGMLGEINPKVLNNFEMEMPAVCAEINLLKLFDYLHP